MKEMDLDQMRIAMVEISGNRTKDSKLKKEFPEDYTGLEKEMKEIVDKGGLIDIPPEIP